MSACGNLRSGNNREARLSPVAPGRIKKTTISGYAVVSAQSVPIEATFGLPGWHSRTAIGERNDMTGQGDKADRKMSAPIPVPDMAEREREAVRRAVQRNARGNIQLAQGKFITPEDKDLGNLSP